MNGVEMNDTANGATEPASVHIEPLTTLVVIPAVDGACFGASPGESTVSSGVTGISLSRTARVRLFRFLLISVFCSLPQSHLTSLGMRRIRSAGVGGAGYGRNDLSAGRAEQDMADTPDVGRSGLSRRRFDLKSGYFLPPQSARQNAKSAFRGC